ncbi:FecCD family ABC transporter permease [Thermoflexibacter ruber]|uniref:Iron complex transport system permease protein n=1 Tax=Thermoflexibacter ruber TaxID=1003 RepID=A0A1I2ENE6_9BACT|nr:iron ABC transporter permease [Thermoflexibacter ruber]SFE94233.1 iron complex transport system permease protein [Thermoflexibacter ruber]
MKTLLGKSYPFFIFFFLLLVFFIADVSYGSVYIPLDEVFNILLKKNTEKKSWEIIVWQFRLPKATTALLAGAGLSVSGLLMQTLFRNPLADAYILGVSSGASLGVALLILAGVGFASFAGQWAIAVSAVVGAASIMALVLFIATQVRQLVSLLIIGLMLGNGVGALIVILQSFSNKEELQRFANWTYGSLGGVDWEKMLILAPLVLVGLFSSIFLYKPLNSLLLGDNYALSMGLNIHKIRIQVILLTSLITGCITAFCGIIGFVGIAVPHICRYLLDTSEHKRLLPACAFLGAILMLACDMLCQLPYSPHVLPINAITALVGVPVVVWVILRRR